MNLSIVVVCTVMAMNFCVVVNCMYFATVDICIKMGSDDSHFIVSFTGGTSSQDLPPHNPLPALLPS